MMTSPQVSWLFFKARATSISRSIRKERATRKKQTTDRGPEGCVENGPAAALLVGYVSIQICALLTPVRLGPPCRRPILNATPSPLYARRYTIFFGFLGCLRPGPEASFSFLDQERQSFVRHIRHHFDDFVIGEIVLSEWIAGQYRIKLPAFDCSGENKTAGPGALAPRYEENAIRIVFAEPRPMGIDMLINFTQWSFVTKDYCVHSVFPFQTSDNMTTKDRHETSSPISGMT